jgi:hypothetical protein
VCTPAINILEDMGVLKELMDNNEAHFADAGGSWVECTLVVDSDHTLYLRKHEVLRVLTSFQ